MGNLFLEPDPHAEEGPSASSFSPSHDHEELEIEEELTSKEDQEPPSISLPPPTTEPYQRDPALWPDTITENIRDYVLLNKPNQIYGSFAESAVSDGKWKRSFKDEYFYRVMANGDKVKREWMVYSGGRVYCYVCKLFTKPNVKTQISHEGLKDWKNIKIRLSEHENSPGHRDAMCTALSRSESAGRIDTKLFAQIGKERLYWREVLKRVVATVKVLASRGLAFRGSNEELFSPHNGNYLGCLEYLSEFDPFLAEHLARYGNAGSGTANYLSSTTCDEFIEIMGTTVQTSILNDVREAKYFGLIIDSTPDISHFDQLTIILRFLTPTSNSQGSSKPVERFVGFITFNDHSAANLEKVILDYFKDIGVDLRNCRGQSFDNASNMSGVYTGLQARIKEHVSEAHYAPCASHSLNLVINKAVECNKYSSSYFDLLSEVYNFLSKSVKRWQMLKNAFAENKKALTVKRLSATRWSARADATAAIKRGFSEIIALLRSIGGDVTQKAMTRTEANAIASKLDIWETALMTVMWNSLLGRFNATSKSLQDPSITLGSCVELCQSLLEFIQNFRKSDSKFKLIEEEARKLTDKRQYNTELRRSRKQKRFFDEIGIEYSEERNGKRVFLVEVLYAVCDTLIAELKRRLQRYEELNSHFRVLFEYRDMSVSEIKSAAINLMNMYKSDLEEGFEEELDHFVRWAVEKKFAHPLEMYNCKLVSTAFPNVYILLRIYLTIPSSNASAERSFSALKRVKNYLRSNMHQERLSGLSILAIEAELTKKISFDEAISEFAHRKARKHDLA